MYSELIFGIFIMISFSVLGLLRPILDVMKKGPFLGLGFTQPLTEISTRNIKIIMFLGSKVRPVRRADNLTVIYEPIVQTMWNP
jgi:hypothetical protein